MQPPPASVGNPLDEIDTPALVLDLDALEGNIARMADAVRKSGVRLRPHAKSHKCAEIARRQIAAGAVGVCCQKVSEAEALADGGVADVLVTNEIVGKQKLARLARLAREAKVGVLADDAGNVADLDAAAQAEHVRLDVLVEIAAGAEKARLTKALIENAGIACETITGAGTGTFMLESASRVYNEIQPGSYVFMDADYNRNVWEEAWPRFEQSLFVLATVMSAPAPDRAVLDAGLKASSVDSGLPQVYARPGVEYAKASDEHGVLKIAAGAKAPKLGEKLLLVPGHCDPTVNLYDWFVCVRKGKVEAWWPVTARGAVW